MSVWDFFKDIVVISLKSDIEKHELCTKTLTELGCTKFRFSDGVPAKTNPYLRASMKARNILGNDAHISQGSVGCIAAHRKVWENCLYDVTTHEPYWTLIFEDDFKFHPLFTHELFQKYLDAIPKDAKLLKFGYLATPQFSRTYNQENAYWINFNNGVSFSTHCYAVRSDMFSELLAIRYSTNIDWVAIRCAYGAVYPETVLGLPTDSYMDWRNFLNTYINLKEPYHGFVACYEHVSEAR
jgi:GR25 family glycosyltransferase involved in LPS biosynthesis